MLKETKNQRKTEEVDEKVKGAKKDENTEVEEKISHIQPESQKPEKVAKKDENP